MQVSSKLSSLDSILQESNQLDWTILEIFISPTANALHAEGNGQGKISGDIGNYTESTKHERI